MFSGAECVIYNFSTNFYYQNSSSPDVTLLLVQKDIWDQAAEDDTIRIDPEASTAELQGSACTGSCTNRALLLHADLPYQFTVIGNNETMLNVPYKYSSAAVTPDNAGEDMLHYACMSMTYKL